MTTSIQALLNLIGRENEITLAINQVTISPPSTEVGSSGKNTAVTLTAVQGQGYTGTADVFYDRVALSSAPDGLSTEFLMPSPPATTHGLLDAINERYNLSLQPIDIVDTALPAANPDGSRSVTLQAAAISYGWIGTLAITLVPGTVDLADVILVTELDGLTLPDLVEPEPTP